MKYLLYGFSYITYLDIWNANKYPYWLWTATWHGLLDKRFGENIENFEPIWILTHAVGFLFLNSEFSNLDGLKYH